MNPESCDMDIYRNGEHIFSIYGLGLKARIEEWVRFIALWSGQRVDWHYVGGVACVRALGDVAKVKRTILDNPPDFCEGCKFV